MSTTPPIPYGTKSPDGRWFWDGSGWQAVPVTQEAPPQQPAPPQYQPSPPQAPPPQYGQPQYMPTAVPYPQGPLGRRRSIGVSILLAIVTLFIYSLVWVYKTHNEIKRHSGIGVGGVIGLVIFIVVAPVTYFVIPSEVRQMYEAAGRQSPVRGIYGLWILLPIIGNIIWFVQVQGALNRYWEWRGAPPPGTPQPAQPYATAPPPAPSAPPPPPPPPPPAHP